MRLFISKKRWHEIFRVLARRKRKQICLFGTRANGRYNVLWAAGARGIRTAGRALARGRRVQYGGRGPGLDRQYASPVHPRPTKRGIPRWPWLQTAQIPLAFPAPPPAKVS